MNDLLLVVGIPIALFCVVFAAKLVDVFVVECFHNWGPWVVIDPKNEAVFVQQRFCRKCNMREINQIKKEKNGSAI